MSENILKTIVIILGVLIVIALGGLVYGIAIKVPEVTADKTNKPYEITTSVPKNYSMVEQKIVADKFIIIFEDNKAFISRIYDIQDGTLLGEIKVLP